MHFSSRFAQYIKKEENQSFYYSLKKVCNFFNTKIQLWYAYFLANYENSLINLKSFMKSSNLKWHFHQVASAAELRVTFTYSKKKFYTEKKINK